MGERTLCSRDRSAARGFAPLVRALLWSTSPTTRKDPPGCGFHRRPHLWSSTTELLQRCLQPAHVSSLADLRAPHRLPAGGSPAPRHCCRSCSNCAPAVAPGAAPTEGISRNSDPASRRCWFCVASPL